MFGVIRGIYRGAGRHPMTSKRGHNYYKGLYRKTNGAKTRIQPQPSHSSSSLGTGSGSMGRHTKRGGYEIDWNKVRTFVVPEMAGFKLKPYVQREAKPSKSGAFTAENYLSVKPVDSVVESDL
ncbi:LOW QUALITY PROTEIN: mitochondrial ribosomal protein L27-domain-containing protein [Endogone sp. FLAS-F59071]|nr:LOW QUALITY PROTEIN: mitochondrial ribosomal protein L27-domain-containing protein [Endogone sp. FLAS-F59071]|eukprot:RUS14587.1 LOW QUALITY PROTEIN: mitochondrial ribosomal protein L27-domain-containing protein [Endogone sp. FLAS-F59071]